MEERRGSGHTHPSLLTFQITMADISWGCPMRHCAKYLTRIISPDPIGDSSSRQHCHPSFVGGETEAQSN